MNYRKVYKSAAVLTLSAVIAGTSAVTIPAAEKNTEKEENVYVNLKEDGSVDGIYVVNAYDLDQDQKIVDYGNYSSVKNLSADGEIKADGEKITVNGEKGKFYYQGNLESADLPWKINIEYRLDGKKITPEKLAGKSGALEIRMHIDENKKADSDFFEHYLLQAALTLDTEMCKNIKAEGATAANSGKNKQLTYNILAGQEKDITIRADVKDFQMDPITINGVPMSFDIDLDQMDTSALTDKTTELTDGAKTLNDGAKKTSEGAGTVKKGLELYGEGVDDLYAGADTLFSGAEQMNFGIHAYTAGAAQTADGAQELRQKTQNLPKLMESLTEACEELQKGSGSLADEKSWNQVENGMNQIQAGLIKMKAGLNQIDSQGIDKIQQSLEGSGELKSGMEDLQRGLKGIESYADQLSSVSDAYDSQAQKLKSIIENGTSSKSAEGEKAA